MARPGEKKTEGSLSTEVCKQRCLVGIEALAAPPRTNSVYKYCKTHA